MNRMEDQRENGMRRRLLLFGGVIMAVFSVFTFYLFNLQVVENRLWEGRARAVSRRSEPLPAQRGLIWDRSMDMPMAMNIDSFAVFIVPAEIPPSTPEQLSEILAPILDVDAQTIAGKLPRNWKNSYSPVEIRDGVSYETIVRLAESVERFPGVQWSDKPYRWYPDTDSLSHILGYVGGITNEELQILYNRGYANTASLGKSGAEKSFDAILRGQDGRLFHTVDVRGRDQGGNAVVMPPENGLDIVLTIDRRVQNLAEKALGQRKGALVVLQPSTGEILAMVSHPSFDPNSFDLPGPDSFDALSVNPNFPFLNRAIHSTYPPASTFKLIMTAAILGENAVDPAMTINCRGVMKLGDREFWCHKKSGHGRMNLSSALAQSCNIYFGTVGVEYLGIDTIAEYSRAFGFGLSSGVILDGEEDGVVPSKSWKEERFQIPWTGGDTLNASIGQGFLAVTPLQMANAVAAIANRGVMYRPRLLKEIRRSGTGTLVEQTEPEILRVIDKLDESDYDFLQAAMRGVVTNGTAQWAIYTKAVAVAGKTGTGEFGSDERWHSWFAAYGPYEADREDQRIAVAALVESSNEWWAPKAADIVFEGYFSNRDYEQVLEEWQRRRVWWSEGMAVHPAIESRRGGEGG